MKRVTSFLFCIVVMAMFTGNAVALESLVDSVAKGCEKELTSYCSKVTPGEGRILACIYAHGDKISGRCEYALYDAAAQLEWFVAALSYLTNECEDDIDKLCASVLAGEGRIATCLDNKFDMLSKRCKQAVKDVGVKVEK